MASSNNFNPLKQSSYYIYHIFNIKDDAFRPQSAYTYVFHMIDRISIDLFPNVSINIYNGHVRETKFLMLRIFRNYSRSKQWHK
jgi:hypothetical protein